jgi:predicted RNA-binding Zn-ribbon protein involved in translation (DUF1610 family)
MTEHKCPDCGSAMEEGYIPDYGYGSIKQLTWQPGQPKPAWIFDGIKSPNDWQARTIVAYCCTNCGLLKFVALNKRTAQGTQTETQ